MSRLESRLCKDAKHKCSSGSDLLWDVWWRLGAPQLLQRRVILYAARDDDGRSDTKLLMLFREVDLLGGRGARELVDRQRVAVDAACTRELKCSSGVGLYCGTCG